MRLLSAILLATLFVIVAAGVIAIVLGLQQALT